MRHLLIALALVTLSGLSLSGQSSSGIFPSPPWCPTCFVASAIDVPNGPTLTSSTTVWGWAGHCGTGTSVFDIDATVVVNGQPVTVDMDFVLGGPRPDVTAHLQAHGCQGGHDVFAAWFNGGLPAGTTAVSIRLRHLDTFAWHTFSVQ